MLVNDERFNGGSPVRQETVSLERLMVRQHGDRVHFVISGRPTISCTLEGLWPVIDPNVQQGSYTFFVYELSSNDDRQYYDDLPAFWVPSDEVVVKVACNNDLDWIQLMKEEE